MVYRAAGIPCLPSAPDRIRESAGGWLVIKNGQKTWTHILIPVDLDGFAMVLSDVQEGTYTLTPAFAWCRPRSGPE